MKKQEIMNRLTEVAQTKGEHLKTFKYEILNGSILIYIEYKTHPNQATINRNIIIELDKNDNAFYAREFHTINCWNERWVSFYRKNWAMFLMQNHIEYFVTFDEVFPNDTIALFTVKINDNHTITYEYNYNTNILERITSEKSYAIED